MKKNWTRALGAASAALLISSCSISKGLQDGELRLARNEVVVVNDDPDFRINTITPSITQRPNTTFFGFNPFLYIYSWSGGKDDGIHGFFKKIGEAPVVFEQTNVEISRKRIESKLESMGWFNSTVRPEVLVKDSDVTVRYIVTLGQRYTISDITFDLPKKSELREDFLADTESVLIKKGDYISEDLFQSELSRSINAMSSIGYYAISPSAYRFKVDTLAHDGTAKLVYSLVDPDKRIRKAHFGKVTVSLPEDLKIKESLLSGMNLIHASEPYDPTTVAYTSSRFNSLKIFNRVDVETTPRADSTEIIDCNIVLHKARLQGFKSDFEVSTNSTGLMGISPKLNVYHKNIFGGGEWFNIGFTGNFQFRLDDDVHSNEIGTNLTLSIPQFLGLGYGHFNGPNVPRTEFSTSFSYQNRPEFTRSLFATSFGYSGNLMQKFQYQFYPLQISYVRLFDLNSKFAELLDKNPFLKYSYQSHCDVGLGGSLTYSSTTDLIPKTDYWTIRANGDVSGNLLSLISGPFPSNPAGEKLIFGAPFSQYARVQFSLARGIRFGINDEQSLAFRLLGGIGMAYGNSSVMPYEKQFYCGGASSMRGWNVRALGPGASKLDKTFSIPSQTGDVKLEADVEYRFPMFWKIEGALFAEAGNVWERKQGVDLADIAADWGLGVRVNLSMILLRLDFGMRLLDPSLDGQKWIDPVSALRTRGFGIHFGVGYPF